ncbi:hypothetical protein [Pseudomonas yamanorum]|uniref:hypothetical protein n=1 Tax=Pseudomonas yamanorum TaxID=515393 RepID=UPI003BA3ADD6
MFSIIQQLNTHSLDYSKTTKQVSHSSEQMRLTVGGQISAKTVQVNANKLQNRVALFEVSGAAA